MRLRHLCIFLLWVFIAPAEPRAQSCGSISYTSDDGLPPSNYNCLYQDSRGILWVGSYGGGVSFFDGKKWENWTQAGKLFSNTVNNVCEDREGAFWFNHYEHGLSRLKGGKWQVFNFDFQKDTCPRGRFYFDRTEKIPYILKGNSGQVFEYDFSKTIFVDTKRKAIPEEISAKYDVAAISYLGNKPDNVWVYAYNLGDKKRKLFQIKDGKALLMPLLPARWGDGAEPLYLTTDPVSGDERGVYRGKEGLFFMENGQPYRLPEPVIERYSAGGKTPSLAFNGAWYDEASNSLFAIYYLDDKSVEKRYLLVEYDSKSLRLRRTLVFSNQFLNKDHNRPIIKDAAGTIWLATSGNVVRLFPDKMYLPFSAPGMPAQVWSTSQAGDGNIWFASYGGGLAAFDGLYLKPPPIGLVPIAKCNDGSLTDEQGNMYFNAASQPLGILKFDGKNKWEFLSGNQETQGFYLNRDKKGQIMWGTNMRGLWILPKNKAGRDTTDWIRIGRIKGLQLDNVLTCLEDNYGRYWMGRSSQGIAMYDPKTDKVVNWMRTDPKNYGCMSTAEDSRGNLWFGTDRGLCFFENRPDIGPDFDLQKNLVRVGLTETDSSTVMSLVAYNPHWLVFGNTKGLFMLDLDAFYAKERQVHVRAFNLKNGYQGGPVGQNAFFISRDSTIWMAAANGAARFDPRILPRDTVLPEVFLDSLRAGSGIFKGFSKVIGLNSGERFVQLFFHAPVNPMLLDNTRFEYRLLDNGKWGKTTIAEEWVKVLPGEESVTFTSLKAGDYTFELRAVKEGMVSRTAAARFDIPKVWWQNPLFWLLVIGILSTIGGLLFRQFRKIKNQEILLSKNQTDMEKLGREKTQLQVAAIVNQLNPHFINNTLNWLQIRVDEDDEAVEVVSKLSQNISMIFKNSRQKKPFHALREELRLTENYLFIQKCRFRDRLEYEMPDLLPNSLIAEVNVPLMMTQIHVENAVEHGIRNKKDGAGMVSIAAREDERFIILTITDNGVGRKAAAKIGSKGTQNGTLMLKELERIYNAQNLLQIEQHYEDDLFVLPDGTACGTRVTVRIPKVYNFEI